MMEAAREKPDIERINAFRKGSRIGRQIELHDVIDSTNTRARELAQSGAPHGTVVLARSQTAGRGRFDRRFFSPPDSGVYLSLVLRPECTAAQAALLTPLMAVAVARTIEETSETAAQIKWVNDVYMAGRKACGILCEASLSSDRDGVEYVIAGIGVNVGRMEIPDDLRGIVTSVSAECGFEVSINRFTAVLLDTVEELLACKTNEYMREYARRSNVVGRDVTVLRGAERFEAHAEEIDLEGNLIVRTRDGEKHILHSGEVSLKFS